MKSCIYYFILHKCNTRILITYHFGVSLVQQSSECPGSTAQFHDAAPILLINRVIFIISKTILFMLILYECITYRTVITKCVNDFIDVVLVRQEVLPEALLGPKLPTGDSERPILNDSDGRG